MDEGTQTETPVEVDDFNELDMSGIAQYLSELSQGGQLPQGMGPKIEIAPFQADDVTFDDNDWIVKLLAVQAWLCLDQPLSRDALPQDAAIRLMEQISPDPADACIKMRSEEVVTLTDLGAQHLETWLSRASANREAFLELLDDDRAIRDATEEWRLLWEEAGSFEGQPTTIKADVKTLTIRNFSDYAKDGQLELNPSYQRDSVWSTSDSQLLIDSILRGIPIPSIILSQVEGNDKLQIVDGKQRLTAILRFIGQHPAARAYAKGFPGGDEELSRDHRKFIRKRHLRSKDVAAHYLPFQVRRYPPSDPLHKISGKYYSEIRDEDVPVGSASVKISKIFDNALSQYHLPVIIYDRTRLQDIHHVFSIYNKQGKKLNAEELRNATFHHLALTKLLLVLSGDRPDPSTLAPYLPPDVRTDIDEVGATLRDRGFGTLRFKRTKLLSWVFAVMLHPPNRGRDGAYATPSTASHIDSLLRHISEKQGSHPLYHSPTLVTLARDVKLAVRLHDEAEDAWSPRFRSKKGYASRWEELPLVASILPTMILVAIGEPARLQAHLPKVRAFTEANPGDPKSQNKTQWEYISRLTIGILRELDVNLEAAAKLLEERYGHSCMGALLELSGHTQS